MNQSSYSNIATKQVCDLGEPLSTITQLKKGMWEGKYKTELKTWKRKRINFPYNMREQKVMKWVDQKKKNDEMVLQASLLRSNISTLT